jgi:uncharacterized protein YkwD
MLLLLVTALICVTAQPAAALTESRQGTLRKISHARSHHGVRQYHVRHRLNHIAQRWAEWMAAHQSLQHNPYLSHQVHGWNALGENVGRAAGFRRVHRAFMHSPPHRANILSPTFHLVGVGAAHGSDGKLYVDEIFKRNA